VSQVLRFAHLRKMTAFNPIHFLLGVALLCLSACTTDSLSGGAIGRLSRSSAIRKPSSLVSWREQRDPRLEMLKATAARTSLLLSGIDRVLIASSHTPRGTQKFMVSVKNTKGAGTYGSAVPISPDGYFLTAEHCIGAGPLALVVFTKDDRLLKLPARVVWAARSDSGVPDLAILHARVKPFSPFSLADLTRIKPREPVALAGWSQPHFNSLAAGRIVKIGSPQLGAAGLGWRSIRHDAPFAVGDSGGPLITSDGRLAGINAQMSFNLFSAFRVLVGLDGSAQRPLFGYDCEAILPDRDWLECTIEADRLARRSSSKTRGDS
jgi:S1-C subfamily serine protease